MSEIKLDLAQITVPSVVQYSVSELCNQLKKVVESNFSYVKVKGEVIGLKIATSGHCYFSLKDGDATIACTCWRSVMARVSFKLEDGMQIVVTGSASIYAPQSKYQFSVDKIETDGIGSLMQLLQARKEKLQKEGLFDESRKRKLPFFPKKIAVVTSLSGAVIRDIIHRLRERCPTHVMVWPCLVQGETASDEITAAIDQIQTLNDKPDVIIVARGGGSFEDLWCFNEENVVRAVARSSIPVISAVGHETDFTLIDFVADVRAPTPTAAAEIAVPVLSELKAILLRHFASVISSTNKGLQYHNASVGKYNIVLSRPPYIFKYYRQKLDDINARFDTTLGRYLDVKIVSLKNVKLPSNALTIFITNSNTKLSNLFNMSVNAMRVCFIKHKHNITMYSNLLNNLNVERILDRGFCITRNDDGKIVSSAKAINNTQQGTIQFHDGTVIINMQPS